MTDLIAFTVPGTPVPKGRARAYVRAGRVAHYTPDATARYENLVKLAAQQAMQGREPFNGPLCVFVRFVLPVPASYSKKRTAACLELLEAPSKRPDVDNLLKAVSDGCNAVVWHDDCQVVQVVAEKHYGATPGCHVQVRAYGFTEAV